MRVLPEGNDMGWLEPVQQRAQHIFAEAGLALTVATITHGIVSLVRVKWKHIPKERWIRELANHFPDFMRGALGYRRSGGRLPNRYVLERQPQRVQVRFVSKGEPGAPAATIPEVAADPDAFHADRECSLDDDAQVIAADFWRVVTVMFGTEVGVRVEDVFEFEAGKLIDEYARLVHGRG